MVREIGAFPDLRRSTTEEKKMDYEEGDIALETEIGRKDDAWCWRIRGYGIEGWRYGGPFDTKRAAQEDADRFMLEHLDGMGVEVTYAPLH
jgi:hypothetical protein